MFILTVGLCDHFKCGISCVVLVTLCGLEVVIYM